MRRKDQSSKRQRSASAATSRRGRSPHWVTTPAGAAVVAGVATVIAAVVTGVFTVLPARPGTGSAPTVSPSIHARAARKVMPHSRIPGDKSIFVKDVTFPDNSSVKTCQHFTKKWELKNDGAIPWQARYLIPDGTSTGNCSYPPRVRVPATKPGQTVIISVPVIAAQTPGLCYVTWKMANATGSLYFPGYVGIWFEIKVLNPVSM